MRGINTTRPTSTAFAATALAETMIPAPTAGAQPPDPLGPQDSVRTSPSIPGSVTPAKNRPVASGPNGTCPIWVAADIRPDSYSLSATYSWTTDAGGADTCPTATTLYWRNVDPGAAGTTESASTGPGHD